jgi:hypothetical protein
MGKLWFSKGLTNKWVCGRIDGGNMENKMVKINTEDYALFTIWGEGWQDEPVGIFIAKKDLQITVDVFLEYAKDIKLRVKTKEYKSKPNKVFAYDEGDKFEIPDNEYKKNVIRFYKKQGYVVKDDCVIVGSWRDWKNFINSDFFEWLQKKGKIIAFQEEEINLI